MVMIAGDKVVYPGQGPCLIDMIVLRSVDGGAKSFYHLLILVESGGELFVPADKAQAIGLRPLLKASEIPQLLDHLATAAPIVKDRKHRASDLSKLRASGSAFDLTEIVKSLTELSKTRTLSFHERRALERARNFLICEISEVMGESRDAAENRVEQALEARKISNGKLSKPN